MKDENQNLLKCFLTACITTVIFYCCGAAFLKPVMESVVGSANIPSLTLSILLDLLLFIALRKCQVRIPDVIIKIGFAAASLFLLISYFLEKNIFHSSDHLSVEMKMPWYLFAAWIMLCCLAVFFLISDHPLRGKVKKAIRDLKAKTGRDPVKICLIFTTAVLTGLTAYHYYNLNFTAYYDYYNINTYLNSILNLFWGQPFTTTITGIYGHYAFFYYPVLKAAYALGFHSLYKVFTLTITVLNVLTLLIWIRILCWNVRSGSIRLLGIFMLCHVDAARLLFIYPATRPNRTFPLAVMALMISLWYREKPEKKKRITTLGYIACLFLIIWNTECGLFALISWAALHICSALQTGSGRLFGKILLHAVLIPAIFFGAVFTAGILNVLHGGEMIPPLDFIFPMNSAKHMSEISVDLAPFPAAWISISVLLFAFLCRGIKDTLLCTASPRPSDQSAACFSFTVLSVGILSFAVNRPAYANFFVMLPFAGVMTAILADSYFNDAAGLLRKKTERKAVNRFCAYSGLLSLSVLVFMTGSTLINIPNKLTACAHYKDTAFLSETVQWITSAREKDAAAIGTSPSMFYAYLGLDPGIYYMDTPNYHINDDAFFELIEKTKSLEGRSLYVSNDFRWYLPEEFRETHTMVSSFKKNDILIEYWMPTQ